MKKTLIKLAMVFSLIFCISSTLHISMNEYFTTSYSNNLEYFKDLN